MRACYHLHYTKEPLGTKSVQEYLGVLKSRRYTVSTKVTSPSSSCPNFMQNDKVYVIQHQFLPTSHTATNKPQASDSMWSTAEMPVNHTSNN